MRPVEARIMAPVEKQSMAPIKKRLEARLPGFCPTSNHTQVHESPPAAQRTHHSDGTKTQHGVSCTGSLTKERVGDAGRAKAAALRSSVTGAKKQQNPCQRDFVSSEKSSRRTAEPLAVDRRHHPPQRVV